MRTIQKKWYHITTKENLKKIRSSGFLASQKRYFLNSKYICETYLSASIEHLEKSLTAFNFFKDTAAKGDVILTVLYTPNGIDDAVATCSKSKAELTVFKPIPVENIKVLKYL